MAASEHQERLNRLRESVDASARNLRVVYVSFLLIALYLVAIISSTAHEDLFYANDVVMPIVNIGVPIVWFYAVVPGLFLLLHFNLLIQFYFLSHKVIAFEQALGDGGTYGGKSYGGEPYQAEQRGALFPSPFSHLLAGSHYSTPFRILLGIFVFVSTIVLPLSILLYAQIKFPPYQDDGITWAHRGVIGIDLALVAIYLPIIHSGSQGGWMQALNFWRHPVSRIIPCSAILFWIVFVAETAGGPVERWTGFKEISDASVGVIFSRTFDFHDLVLVAEPPPPEILAAYIAKWQATKAEKGGEAWELFAERLDLRGRSFRYADFTGATFYDAKFTGADLRDAILSFAKLQGADLREAQLQEANLRRAQLQGAYLRAAQLQGAELWRAQLQGAILYSAEIRGAEFKSAGLELSDLRDIDIIRPDPNNFREFDDYWEKIRQQITNIVRADAREAAIERIDYAQTRAGEPMSLPEHVLKPSNSTDNALINYYPGKNYIDEFGLQADGEVFHKLRAGFLRELACDQRSYPEVAFSVVLMSIGLYVESDDRGGIQHYLELGRQLLDEPCPTGGMIDISPEERALFEERLAEHETESAD